MRPTTVIICSWDCVPLECYWMALVDRARVLCELPSHLHGMCGFNLRLKEKNNLQFGKVTRNNKYNTTQWNLTLSPVA